MGWGQGSILSLTSLQTFYLCNPKAMPFQPSSDILTQSLDFGIGWFVMFDIYSFQVQSGFVKIVDLLFEPLSAVMSLVLIWQFVGVATMGAVGVILLYVPANILLARKYASFQVIYFLFGITQHVLLSCMSFC